MNNYNFSDSYDFAEGIKKKNQSYVDAVKDQSGAGVSSNSSGPSGEDKALAAAQVAKTLSSNEGSGTGKLGNAMMIGSTMGGPAAPWLLGGGLALSTLDQVRANKQAQENAKRQAYIDTIKNQQNAIDDFQKIFSGRMV